MISSDLAPPYIGGGESYVINLGTELVRLGHEVHWLTSKITGTNGEERYQGIHIHRVPIFLPSQYIFPGRQSYALTSILPGIQLAKNMDIIQTNTFVPAVTGWLIAKYSRKPSICFVHELFGPLWKSVGNNALEKRLYPLMERFMALAPYDAFACPSEYSKQTLTRAGASCKKITVIPHGISSRIFGVSRTSLRKKFGLEKNKVVGYTGRLRIRGTGQLKNLPMLLEAFSIVAKRIPEARLALGGTDFSELHAESQMLGIDSLVIYTGSRPHREVPRFLAMTDVVVCPALADGFCFLLEEAAVAGKPLVATNAGAHPERIVHGKNGILTDVTAVSLAEGIMAALDKRFATKASAESRKHARNFTWEKAAKAHLQLYESVIRSHGNRTFAAGLS